MIVRDRKNILQMLFIWRGSVLRKILPTLVFVFIFSCLVYILHLQFPQIVIPLNSSVFALVGISLAIFLGFCNNAAYDRFWEGRKQWGLLVIYARTLTIQIQSLISENAQFSKEDKKEGVGLIIAFCYALKKQLRGKDNFEYLIKYLKPDVYNQMLAQRFKPVFLLLQLNLWIATQCKNHRIDTITQARLDESVEKLSNILGACERIIHTKIPFVYFAVLHRMVYLYCFTLPFGLIDSIVWVMPFFVTFVSYTFIALDAIVAEISEPFGEEDNDLALHQMCKNIEYALAEISDLPLPEIIIPNKNFVIN